jgi:DNA-binding GntR family transcriptional regulator
MGIRPLKPTDSLSNRAYDAVKDAILSLQLRPGEFFSIGSLADQLDVSRTPVREALLLLEREGLVHLVPHKGAYIAQITRQDVEEIFELRILLESYAAGLACDRLVDSELERLEQLLKESKRAIDQHEYLTSSDLGRQIHDVLVQKAENSRLNLYLNDLDAHYTRIRRLSALMQGRLYKSHEQHVLILSALKARDPEGARQAMADHLSSVRDDILANIDDWITDLVSANGQERFNLR